VALDEADDALCDLVTLGIAQTYAAQGLPGGKAHRSGLDGLTYRPAGHAVGSRQLASQRQDGKARRRTLGLTLVAWRLELGQCLDGVQRVAETVVIITCQLF